MATVQLPAIKLVASLTNLIVLGKALKLGSYRIVYDKRGSCAHLFAIEGFVSEDEEKPIGTFSEVTREEVDQIAQALGMTHRDDANWSDMWVRRVPFIQIFSDGSPGAEDLYNRVLRQGNPHRIVHIGHGYGFRSESGEFMSYKDMRHEDIVKELEQLAPTSPTQT